ncbi:ATP-binding protein [Altibacter lentus]|uniref:ATP-binding protein n=1 Tax=Altibacter lentus TaxID=1223410 RepID=UPI00068CE6E4|nr:ATP-binding protein [Altibacter lentus]
MRLYLHFLKVLCVVTFLIFSQAVIGQDARVSDSLRHYVVDSDYPLQDLFSKTEVLKEGAENATIKDILERPEEYRFTALHDSVITENSIWLRVSFFPKQSLQDRFIIFKNVIEKYRYVTPHDSILAYYVRSGHIIDSTKSGVFIPASQKSLSIANERNTFPVSLIKNTPITVYLKIYDQNKIYTQLELREVGIPFEQHNTSGWLPAFALILAVYVLAFFFYTKDRSYFYLFGFYACIAIYEQFVENNLPWIDQFFSEIPRAAVATWLILTLGSKVFFLQFGRKFTNLRSISPLWDKIIMGVIGYFLIAIAVQLCLLIYGINPLNYLQFIFAGIGFLAVLVVTIRLLFFKDTLLTYFAASSIWSFIFSITGILWENGILPFWNELNPWIIANVGLMFILALAIARKMQLSERAKSEVEKVREIDTIKSKFFANISHEFRTPLSLILGPVNQSLENIPASETIEDSTDVPVKGKHLKVMKRNALRLQNLVDQILDLSKIDQGKMKLRVTEGDIIQFVRSIVFSFESLTEIKHIHFQTHFPKNIENAYFDRDKLEKIIVNILSNAIKFTPEHGKVAVLVEDHAGSLKISITDTGNGIQKEELTHVFDRFYQTETTQDQGTGIGLALVKELVHLYRGQISVASTEEVGTTFKVLLPYHKSSFREDEIVEVNNNHPSENIDHTVLFSEADEPTTNGKEINADLPLILIVEDNPDLRHYIATQMEDDFTIIMAKDGQEGFSKAEVEIPDLIISDVMMPKMNGYELCKKLKTDLKTSHIPVILLTAKAEQSDKLEGLETGADDYLTKPFDGRELKIRAENLIQQREILRHKFSGELKIRPSQVTLSSMDERFMNQVITAIEDHMSNEFYTVEDLASHVGFSRSQLNRKLKNLTGKSPNQLIREFRLTRAKELLEQRSASISEVAYQVGYTNLSYFSKSYKEAFGMLPSDA